jgi:hypothetical protein
LFFIVIHVTLVFTTGLLRNLNHIYAGRNDSSWIGFGLFAFTMAIMVIAWVAATPLTLRHPWDTRAAIVRGCACAATYRARDHPACCLTAVSRAGSGSQPSRDQTILPEAETRANQGWSWTW